MSKRAKATKRRIPRFRSEDAERRFWATHDTVDYFDWRRGAQPALPNLRPSTTAISIRLPVAMLDELKTLANEQDVPYQSLMKVYLADRLVRERKRKVSE
jgi:predicted DNA binding CopG/RHH family protein